MNIKRNTKSLIISLSCLLLFVSITSCGHGPGGGSPSAVATSSNENQGDININEDPTGAYYVTDRAEWEDMLGSIDIFITSADNVILADEVTSTPGLNEDLGPSLTFRSYNTGLSTGFLVETLEPGAGFTFSETETGKGIKLDYQDALSVGDVNDYQHDDWRLSLLDGASMIAFGVEIKHARFAPGESITLIADKVTIATIDLSSLPDTGNENYFIGIIADEPFNSIHFDEDPDGDDIGIADFRFGMSDL